MTHFVFSSSQKKERKAYRNGIACGVTLAWRGVALNEFGRESLFMSGRLAAATWRYWEEQKSAS